MDVPVCDQSEGRRKAALWIRNLLTVIGIYYLSSWLAALLGWSLDRVLNRFAEVHGQNLFTAIYMGSIVSRDQTLAAILAGAAVPLILPNRRSQFWAFLVAALYLVDFRAHTSGPGVLTAWDHLWMRIEWLCPAVACIIAAFVIARLRGKTKSAG